MLVQGELGKNEPAEEGEQGFVDEHPAVENEQRRGGEEESGKEHRAVAEAADAEQGEGDDEQAGEGGDSAEREDFEVGPAMRAGGGGGELTESVEDRSVVVGGVETVAVVERAGDEPGAGGLVGVDRSVTEIVEAEHAREGEDEHPDEREAGGGGGFQRQNGLVKAGGKCGRFRQDGVHRERSNHDPGDAGVE